MAIRVGRWDCKVCGHKGNLGPDTNCINCGASRPADVKFYLPEDAELVEDEKKIREAKAGADWRCGHCGSHNKAKTKICHACGNPKDDLSEDIELKTITYQPEAVPTEGLKKEDEAGEKYRRARIESHEKQKKKRRKGILGFILSSPLLAAILFFLLRTFPQTIDVEVVGFEWYRSIQFEHYEAVQEEAWQLPQGAKNAKSFRAVHHYDKVFKGYETRTRDVRVKVGEEKYVCGQKDMGNGYFQDVYCTRPIYETRQETYQAKVYDDVPVYKTKYRYEIMRWVAKDAYRKTLEVANHSPRWPEPPSSTNPDRWRERGKEAHYRVVVLEKDGDKHSEEIPFSLWERLQTGQELKAKKSRIMDIYYGLDLN